MKNQTKTIINPSTGWIRVISYISFLKIIAKSSLCQSDRKMFYRYFRLAWASNNNEVLSLIVF